MRRKTQIEEYQIKANGFIVKTYEERIVNKDEKGYYVIGKKNHQRFIWKILKRN